MRTRICCELASGHGGNVDTARAMIEAAAAAGADAVKVQHYGAVNPADPQAAWLHQARLTLPVQVMLMDHARMLGLEFWATPFDATCLKDLVEIGVDRIKIASTEAHADWWLDTTAPLVVSWPWGEARRWLCPLASIHLTAIPLYPTPLECVSRAKPHDGWSDHVVGLGACYDAICQRAQWLEVHLTLGEGHSRVCAWDKSVDDIKRLRDFAEDVETMKTGIGRVFRERWKNA